MSELHRYAIHFDWIPGHSQNGPVGIWNEHGECHYPKAMAALQVEGAQSYSSRGTSHTFESWLAMREETTSTYGANWSSIDTDESMETVIEAMAAEFLAVEHPQMTFIADAADSPNASEVDEPGRSTLSEAPSLRRIIAESWWIASELAARHPEYVVWEMHPGGGTYDCLALLKPGDESPDVQLNRAGSLHVLSGDFHLSWREVLADPSSHGPVKSIEEAAGLTLNEHRPPSTQRTLTYRFIGALLRMQIHDRYTWDARNEFLDSSGWESADFRGYMARFPAAVAAARSTTNLGLYGEPQSHFWAILRDEKPVGLVSVEGVLYRDNGTFDLMAEYRAAGRSLTLVITKCVGDWLR